MGIVNALMSFIGYPVDDHFDGEDEGETSCAQNRPMHTAERATRHADNIHKISTAGGLQVVLAKPERFEDAGNIANDILANRAVLLNLECVARDISRRLIDFLSGVAYPRHGQINRVATGTYLITPQNVSFIDDGILWFEDLD